MRITIAGCGALGSVLAARLIAGGQTVQILQRAGDQFDALRRSGITITGDRDGRTHHWPLERVEQSVDALQPADLVIVLVKAHATGKLKDIARGLADGGAVLTLQNGLGNAEILAQLAGESRVAAGTITYGAHRTDPGVVRWGGDGTIVVGPWVVGPWLRDARMAWIADTLSGAGLEVTYVDDPRPALWRKLAHNVMTNPVTALTGLNNGQVLEHPLLLEIMQQLGRETAEAAARAGVALDFEPLWAAHREVLERTGSNRSSMLQDLRAGRPTEIEAIAGPILRISSNPQEFPYTRSMYALIKTIDATR